MEAANFSVDMRTIKLSGREASVVRAIGFTNSMLGAEIQDYVRMESDDVTDILNSLMSAGFVESIPYSEQIELAEMSVMAFEVNPAYSHELKRALTRT
jgi:DNA-binding MarR family transcriptional regulator